MEFFNRTADISILPKNGSAQIGCLCYNAANMHYGHRFANNNNHNDNDDLGIVGRSLAG
jgi:hypothetical protein